MSVIMTLDVILLSQEVEAGEGLKLFLAPNKYADLISTRDLISNLIYLGHDRCY